MMIFEAFVNFILKAAKHGIHECRGLDFDFGGMDGLFVKKTGEQKPQQINSDERYGALGREVLSVKVIDASEARVRRNQIVRQFCDLVLHGQSIPQRTPKRKPWEH